MTDRDLIIAAARDVLGWTVVPFDDGKQYRMPSYPAYFWRDGAGAVMIRTSPNQHAKDWNPLTSDADAFMLVDALTAKGYFFSLFSGATWDACFDSPNGGALASAPERCRAIVLAALRTAGVAA